MSNSLWMSSFRNGGNVNIVEHLQAYEIMFSTTRRPDSVYPSLIALIGSRAKARVFHWWCAPGEEGTNSPHGQVRLGLEPGNWSTGSPVLVADCELHVARKTQAIRQRSSGRDKIRQVWPATQPPSQRSLGMRLYSQVLRPFANTICVFGEDCGGFHGACELLAHMVVFATATDTPPSALCLALVVLPGSLHAHDAKNTVVEMLMCMGAFASTDRAWIALKDTFCDVKTVEVAKGLDTPNELRMLREIIMLENERVVDAKSYCRRVFSAPHLQSLIGLGLDRFALDDDSPFILIRACRTHTGSVAELRAHLENLLRESRSRSVASTLTVRLISSALVLNALPPRMHCFAPTQVFAELYQSPLSQALQAQTHGNPRDTGLARCVTTSFVEEYESIISGDRTAVQLRAERLQSLQTELSSFKSNQSCLYCLMNSPEKTLTCGHAICNHCVATFGRKSLSEKYSYNLDACLLCGASNCTGSFQLVPPTAGIRILSVDGGGVRGVLPLTWLQRLERRLGWLGCPLSSYFDLVCGSSSGGLVVLGLFVMGWTAGDCISKFQDLAGSIFQRRNPISTLLTSLQDFLISYIADCKYDSAGIEKALYCTFGHSRQLFNPLQSDAKVAVTATTARESTPCLFTNYNAGRPDRQSGYHLVRASNPEYDATISDAARCTSAAPWYFKAKALRNLGTFQDGGLHYNNPIALALWEARIIWPGKGDPDLALSLGTGASNKNAAAARQGPQSPVTDRFLSRLFRTFMVSMDGDKAWHEIRNTISPESTTRLHRLNVPLDDQELGIDDVSRMDCLRQKAEAYLDSQDRLTPISDSLLAATFYFELDSPPRWVDEGFECHGSILCRLNMPPEGRRALYEHLSNECAFFVVNGRPVPATDRVPRCAPPFRKRVKLVLSHDGDTISIILRSVNRGPHQISGQPTTLEKMVKAQMLDAPFGRVDHEIAQKPLPPRPPKRQRDSESVCQRWPLRRRAAAANKEFYIGRTS